MNPEEALCSDLPVVPDLAAIAARAASLSRGAIVAEASPARSGKQRRFLRALGHHVVASVHVGNQGPTSAIASALDHALARHELVKLKALDTCPVPVGAIALWTHEVLGADVVQILGRTLLIYRARAEDPTIRLP